MADLDSTLLDMSANFKSNEPNQIYIPAMERDTSDIPHDPANDKSGAKADTSDATVPENKKSIQITQ